MYLSVRNLADLSYKDNTLSTRERIAVIKKGIAVFELIFEDKDYLFHSVYLAGLHRYIAAMAMLENDSELALSSLEKVADFAVMSDTLPERADHTSLLVNRLHYDVLETKKNYEFSNCKELYDKMQWERYDGIRDDKRFIAVIEKNKQILLMFPISLQ